MAMSDEHGDLVRTEDSALSTYGAFGEARASLDELARKVGEGVFRVLVLGEFKRGKSTLINALLGVPILPANVTPTTALLTLIKYGPEVKIDLIPFHGEPKRVSVEELAQTLSLS